MVTYIILILLVALSVYLFAKAIADPKASLQARRLKKDMDIPGTSHSALAKLQLKAKPGLAKRFIESFERFTSKERRDKPLTKTDTEVKKLLSLAYIDISPATFTLFRGILGLFFGVAAYIIFSGVSNPDSILVLDTQTLIMAVIAFALLGTLMPMTILRNSVKRRRGQILATMTDAIDLLALSVEAGLGYDAAILKIWERDKSPAMQELVRTMEDINHGVPRRDAYAALSARCNLEEVTMFCNNMAQADTLGISIVNVLKTQADTLRAARRRRVETAIQKAPVKLTFPLVFFIFPTIFLILLGPAFINIMKYL